jgi:hypothetical protein
MKAKKFAKRITLNKQTVANLSSRDLNKALGGGTLMQYTCPLCYTCGYVTCGDTNCNQNTCEYSCGEMTCNGGPC